LLRHIHIRNLAVIDEIDLDLDAGMTTLTGETGAGKSILVDALGLALGERADSDAVRAGESRAEVSAEFDLSANPVVSEWLTEHDLDDDGQCLVRRIVTAEGRSRGYINGNTAPMSLLRQLGQQLVDICGQQAHQSLVRPAVQRHFLDQFGGHQKLTEQVRAAHSLWQEKAGQLEALQNAGREREERLDLLRFQVQELEALNPTTNELEQLLQNHSRAANAVDIAEGINNALDGLYDNEQSAQAIISRSNQNLSALCKMDDELAGIVELLNEADIQITEAVDALRRHIDALDTDPANFQELENRLSALHENARKHRVEPAELPGVLERLRTELDELDNSESRLAGLEEEVAALLDSFTGLAGKLSAKRKKAAAALSKTITENIRTLGMPQGVFTIDLGEPPAIPGPDGYERIEYRVALNPGIQPGSLSKVASGGELSRVSLAIQVAARSSDTVGTLIFDEVDSGVGGAVAEIVGTQLHALGTEAQVVCVTHLPQVASQGDQQLRVSKLTDGKTTRTTIKSLTPDERVEEIARMLGGRSITDATRAHASEMLGSKSA